GADVETLPIDRELVARLIDRRRRAGLLDGPCARGDVSPARFCACVRFTKNEDHRRHRMGSAPSSCRCRLGVNSLTHWVSCPVNCPPALSQEPAGRARRTSSTVTALTWTTISRRVRTQSTTM